MSPADFRARTKANALRVIRVVEALLDDTASRTLGRQLLRSATSVAANDRAAAQAKSPTDLTSKLGTVEEECDESLFWMEMLIAADRVPVHRLEPLQREGTEILAMAVASIRTARARKSPPT